MRSTHFIIGALLSVLALPAYHFWRHVAFKSTRQFPMQSNWDGFFSFRPINAVQPGSVEEVRGVVLQALAQTPVGRVKTVGSGHSWSDVADPTGATMMSLDRLRSVLHLDAAARRVLVDGGMRLNEFFAYLDANGLAIANAPSVSEQSVAGAIATASHGSGLTHTTMSMYVLGVEFVSAEPGAPVYWVMRDDLTRPPGVESSAREAPAAWLPHLQAHLGVLGIVTKVWFQCVPAFRVRSHEHMMPLEELLRLEDDPAAAASPFTPSGAGFRSMSERFEFGKIWLLPFTDQALVHGIQRADTTTTPAAAQATPSEFSRFLQHARDELDSYLMEWANWLTQKLAPSWQKDVNRAILRLGFATEKVREGLGHELFVIPFRVPQHTEIEYSVPARFAAQTLKGLLAVLEERNLVTGFIFELRFVAADNVTLSPNNAAGPRLHFTCGMFYATPESARTLFTAYEEVFMRFEGRPHWAKPSYMTPAYLHAQYGAAWDTFFAFRATMDPQGVFLNPFAHRMFGV